MLHISHITVCSIIYTLLLLSNLNDYPIVLRYQGAVFFFAGVDGVKWKKPVIPGDTLVMEVGECLFPNIVVHFSKCIHGLGWVSQSNTSWFIFQTQKLRNGINDLELPPLRVELMWMVKWRWNWMKCTYYSFVVGGVFDIYISL
jgi:hypothetical protein